MRSFRRDESYSGADRIHSDIPHCNKTVIPCGQGIAPVRHIRVLQLSAAKRTP